MKLTVLAAGIAAAIVASAAPAAAQAPTDAPKWFATAEVGAEAVQNVGALGGVQIGRRLSSRLDVFGEGVYLQDIVTRRQNESAQNVAAYLAQSQGKSASGSLTIPTWAFNAGVRFFLTGERSIRPYVLAAAGGARATLKPAFALSGTDVTTTLGRYGVTLGSDLTGTVSKPAFGGGFGVAAMLGAWSLDIEGRVFSVQLEGEPANASSLIVGFGRRF